MFSLDSAEITALQQSTVDARNFVWLLPKDRETGNPVGIGFWSDGGPFTCDVVDALTGSTVSRSFNGGALVEIGEITRASDIAVRRVEVTLSAIDEATAALLRTYDGRQAPIQIYRGIFTPGTFNLMAPAKPVFVGFVDEAPIVTAALNGTSKAGLRCVSQTVELTRKNPAVRSHESQIARAAGDNFYKDVNTVGDWEVAWGEHRKNGKSVQPFIGITGNPQ